VFDRIHLCAAAVDDKYSNMVQPLLGSVKRLHVIRSFRDLCLWISIECLHNMRIMITCLMY
jgi:hypothetical protein